MISGIRGASRPTCVLYRKIFIKNIITNLLLALPVKELKKMITSWRRYGQDRVGL